VLISFTFFDKTAPGLYIDQAMITGNWRRRSWICDHILCECDPILSISFAISSHYTSD